MPMRSRFSLSRRRLLTWLGATLALLTAAPRPAPAADTPLRRCGTSDCDYVYDPAVGDPDRGIPPGTPFAALPESWICPNCGGPKDAFNPYHLPTW